MIGQLGWEKIDLIGLSNVAQLCYVRVECKYPLLETSRSYHLSAECILEVKSNFSVNVFSCDANCPIPCRYAIFNLYQKSTMKYAALSALGGKMSKRNKQMLTNSYMLISKFLTSRCWNKLHYYVIYVRIDLVTSAVSYNLSNISQNGNFSKIRTKSHQKYTWYITMQ